MSVNSRFQIRRGTAAEWVASNPTLAAGEWGFEKDTGRFKIGRGTIAWNSLEYAGFTPSTVDTITNKTINLSDNTLSGTVAQFNTALSDDNFVTLTGSEILTNKTLTSPTISNPTFTGQMTGVELAFAQSIVFEGTTADSYEMTLSAGEPTQDRVITLPDTTDTLVGRNTQDTLTNKSISGSTNTLTSIPNAALTNSAITINGTAVSLGGTLEIAASDQAVRILALMGAI
jgi:hypothetical protein